MTSPASGWSSPAAHCSSVDFPDPDGPMIAVKLPTAKPALIASSATIAAPARPWRLVTPRNSTPNSMRKRVDLAKGRDQSRHGHSWW